jgi:hypothetical protein
MAYGKVALYSTDIVPTLEPWAATWEPPPSLLIRWDWDIDTESYRRPRKIRRGSVLRTGGGNHAQDMGMVVSDGRITASGDIQSGTWISQATADAIQAAYEDLLAEYYFTDGHQVWLVRFMPGEENAPEMPMDLSWFYSTGDELCAWSITLMVLAGPLTPVSPPEEVTP